MLKEPVIRELLLKRFKSVRQARILFDNPTFLVGHNGAGKSNIVRAVSFLADAMSLPLQAVFDAEGGIAVVRNRSGTSSHPPNFGLGVVFGALNGEVREARYAFEVKAARNYGFEVFREQCRVTGRDGARHWFDRKRAEFSSNVKGVDPSLEPVALGLPVVGGNPRFAPVLRALSSVRAYKIETLGLRGMQEPDSGVGLKKDGSNAASVLQNIERDSRDALERVCEILGTIVPNTTGVRAKKHGNKLSLEFTQTWGEDRKLVFEAFSMSDGTLRALGLLMAAFQKPPPSVMAIEEPEATIHPGALGSVLDLLRLACRQSQLIVTTHSPEVLDAEWIEDGHIRIVESRDGATRAAALSEASRSALREHLMGAGELLRSNALDPEEADLFEDDSDSGQVSLFEGLDG
jgi:predicted ATPase